MSERPDLSVPVPEVVAAPPAGPMLCLRGKRGEVLATIAHPTNEERKETIHAYCSYLGVLAGEAEDAIEYELIEARAKVKVLELRLKRAREASALERAHPAQEESK